MNAATKNVCNVLWELAGVRSSLEQAQDLNEDEEIAEAIEEAKAHCEALRDGLDAFQGFAELNDDDLVSYVHAKLGITEQKGGKR